MSTETTKHTPGPCIARVMPSGHYLLIEDETGRRIGTIHKDINPAIFAAAPDLLAALQECITEDGAWCFASGASTAKLTQRLDRITEVARAAIARATGEV